MSLPGGNINDGIKEISEGPLFKNIDYIVMGLGTNDISFAKVNFAERHRQDIPNMVATCKHYYPNAKVSSLV